MELPPSPWKIKLPYLPNQAHYRIPGFALNWDLVTSILYTKNRAISSTGTLLIWPLLMPFDPAAAAREECNCSHLLPLFQRVSADNRLSRLTEEILHCVAISHEYQLFCHSWDWIQAHYISSCLLNWEKNTWLFIYINDITLNSGYLPDQYYVHIHIRMEFIIN